MLKRKIYNKFISFINNHIVDYPTPSNISYLWSFGSLAGFCLVLQIITGICLAMHFIAEINYAFLSLEHIMRDVKFGWLIRYLHANGASFFFIVVFLHIGRGIFYTSYIKPRELLWCSGLIIFILMMATAFLGYVLPWGQMSLWGATVITTLVSVIPFIGGPVVIWLWGGYSIGTATITKFYALHYLLPFLIVAVVGLHLALLHQNGSTNPLGIYSKTNKISFYPYFYVKDLFLFICLGVIWVIVVYFNPDIMLHSDNYIQANFLITPEHIIPEWYFLPFYAILRAVTDKLGGVIAMGLAILILFFAPFLARTKIRSFIFKPLYNLVCWFFVCNVIFLGWLGEQLIIYPYMQLGQLAAFLYFFLFSLILIIPYIEEYLINVYILQKKVKHQQSKNFEADKIC